MARYFLNKIEDKYYLNNTDIVDAPWTLERTTNCRDNSTVAEGIVPTETVVKIPILEDGEYLLTVGNNPQTEEMFPVKHYLRLQNSILGNIESVLCGCDCKCIDCNEKPTDKLCDILMTTAKMKTYYNLTVPEGSCYYDIVYAQTKCLIQKPVYCNVTEELLLGEGGCKEDLAKQILALDYLAMYFYEIDLLGEDGDKTYTNKKFKTEPIFCCIQELGINIASIEESIEEAKGDFPALCLEPANQPPNVVGNY